MLMGPNPGPNQTSYYLHVDLSFLFPNMCFEFVFGIMGHGRCVLCLHPEFFF
jgi:hypothetical protein